MQIVNGCHNTRMGPLPFRRFWIFGLLSHCFLQVVSQNAPCFQETCQNGMCTWTPGGFMCVCNIGFEHPPGDTSTCIDKNECILSTVCPNGQCINYIGTYHCECNHGYKETSNRQGCIYDASVARSNSWAYSSFLDSIGYNNRDQYASNTNPLHRYISPDPQAAPSTGYQAFINSLQTGPNSQIIPSEYLPPSPQPDFLERYVQNLVDPPVQPQPMQNSYSQNQIQPPFQPQQTIVQPALPPQPLQPAYQPMPINNVVDQQNTYPMGATVQNRINTPNQPQSSNLAAQNGHYQHPMGPQLQQPLQSQMPQYYNQNSVDQQGIPIDQPHMQSHTGPHYDYTSGGQQGNYQPMMPPLQPPMNQPMQPPIQQPMQPPLHTSMYPPMQPPNQQPVQPPTQTNQIPKVPPATTVMPTTTTPMVFVDTEAPEFPATQTTPAGFEQAAATGPPQPTYIETPPSHNGSIISSAANQSNHYTPTSHHGMAIIPNDYDPYLPAGNHYQQQSGHEYTQHHPTYQQSYHGNYHIDQSNYGQQVPGVNNWNLYPAYNQPNSEYGYSNTQTFMPQSYYNQYQQTPYNQYQQSGHYGSTDMMTPQGMNNGMDNSHTGMSGQTYSQFPEQQSGVNEPSYNPDPTITDTLPPVPSVPDSGLPGSASPVSLGSDPSSGGNVTPGPVMSTGYAGGVTDSYTHVPIPSPTTISAPTTTVATPTIKTTTTGLPQQNVSSTLAPVRVDVTTPVAQVTTIPPTLGQQVVNSNFAITSTPKSNQNQTVQVTTTVPPTTSSTNSGVGTFGDTWLKQTGQNVQIGVGLDLSNMNPIPQQPSVAAEYIPPVNQNTETTPYYRTFVQYVTTTVMPVNMNQGVQESVKSKTPLTGYDQGNVFTSPDKNADTKTNQYNTPTQYILDSVNNINNQYDATTNQNNQYPITDLMNMWLPEQGSSQVVQPPYQSSQQQINQMQSGDTMTHSNQWDHNRGHQSNVPPHTYSPVSNNYPTGTQSYSAGMQYQNSPIIPTLELTNPTNSHYRNEPSASSGQTQSSPYQQYNPVPHASERQYLNQNGPAMAASNQQHSNNMYKDISPYQSSYTQNQVRNAPSNTAMNTQANNVYADSIQYPITYNPYTSNNQYQYSQAANYAHNSPSYFDSHVWYTPQSVPTYTDLPMTRAVATYPRENNYGSDVVYGRWKTAGELAQQPPQEPAGNPLASDNILMAFLMSEAFA